jgi:O-methyltransferase
MNLNKFIELVSPLSITSIDRISRLYYELENIRLSSIDGDLVECGVYKGGNILGMMEYCYFHKMNKKIWLYDTFTGMTKPQDCDKDLNNVSPYDQWNNIKCVAGLEEVKKNLSISLYKNIQYIIGDVCLTTLEKRNIPNKISLLRLDTDWFESTMCELKILFPLLERNGPMIVDDYGHWKGCKRAIDTYFINSKYIFQPIDYTGIYLRK